MTFRVQAGHLPVITDPRLVETILNNFVSNAIRYTPPGGRVDIRARRRRAEIVISVRDTGIGIAPGQLERIFDRHYRADEARDRVTGGSGLGLAIARRAAQSIGGRIEVDSKPQSGSVFRLIIPSGEPALARTRKPGSADQADIRHGTTGEARTREAQPRPGH